MRAWLIVFIIPFIISQVNCKPGVIGDVVKDDPNYREEKPPKSFPNRFFQPITSQLLGKISGRDGSTWNNDDPTPVMIQNEGYPVETHYVETEDCYILEMHRIPHGKLVENVTIDRPVAFLQHCLLCSSADYIIAGPQKSLAYLLADAGYDVWMGNYRGNTYSRSHCHLDPDEFEFWNFSWDQMAQYDLPTMINHVVEYTKKDKIFYVGHSMGTTTFMAMERYHPEVYDKIELASLMAPVAYVEHMRSPLRYVAAFDDEIEWLLDLFGIGEFLPSAGLIDFFADKVCKEEDVLPEICSSIMFLLCGWDQEQLNYTLLDTIVHHTPAGASVNTLLQYAQEINTGGFNAFDYGKRQNLDIYGQENPPNYYVSNVSSKVALYWADNDWLAHPTDLIRAASEFPNLVLSYEVPFPKFNHLDFLWAIDAPELVYEVLMEEMQKYV